jgi:hypothetical protein
MLKSHNIVNIDSRSASALTFENFCLVLVVKGDT